MDQDPAAHSDLKSEIAQQKPRDEEGHFMHVDSPPQPTSTPQPDPTPLQKVEGFLSDHTHVAKNQDDLLDVHVGNPLRRIVDLLQDIKKQKAFSFTLKGSLGIVGIVAVLSVFGLFGGSKLLCDKGMQSHQGILQELQYKEPDPSSSSLLPDWLTAFATHPPQHRRIVLNQADTTLVHIPYAADIDWKMYTSFHVIATGDFDTCSNTLTITDPKAIQITPQYFTYCSSQARTLHSYFVIPA